MTPPPAEVAAVFGAGATVEEVRRLRGAVPVATVGLWWIRTDVDHAFLKVVPNIGGGEEVGM